MKEKILEVQQYFVDQIEKGNFKVDEASKNAIKILIDNEYQFRFALVGGQLIHISNHDFMKLPKIKNQKIISKLIQEITKDLKLKEIEKLKSEIQ